LSLDLNPVAEPGGKIICTAHLKIRIDCFSVQNPGGKTKATLESRRNNTGNDL
jgi:hypothetical protein